jgi:DNA-binding NarL/FixJ family response regulator
MRAAGSHKRLRVVIADNDPDALDLAVIDLDLEGHDIVGTAREGTTALDLCERLTPDVLVVDHRMPPGPWGLDVAEQVRKAHPDMRVVIYSNYQSEELLSRAKACGAIFLPKGNLQSLRRAVAGH